MSLNGFIINIVCCVVLDVLSGVILPEGRMRKYVLSVVSVYLFYAVISPIINFIL